MADQKYALLVDYTYFSGNHAAEIACKEELGLPLDQFGIKEVEVGPFRKGEGSDGDAWLIKHQHPIFYERDEKSS